MSKLEFTICILFLLRTPLFAQDDATLLIISNLEGKIILDGIEKGKSLPGSAFRLVTTQGEHYIEVQAINGSNQKKGEIVHLESGKQKILQLNFEILDRDNFTETLSLADINFNLPGSIDVIAWQSSNSGKEYEYPSFYYAFEKGDEIIINVSMSNQKGTNVINVSTYPNNVVRYTNNAFVALKDISIKVPERSIYRITFAANHALTRNCFLKIGRKPISKETTAFNPNVSFKRILTPVQIAEPQSFFVNSGNNAFFSGGKSRVLVPVTLPENTLEWFYRFSASRNETEIEKVKSGFSLFREITGLALTAAGAAVGNLAIELLTQPPGANFCDIFLLPYEFGQMFEAKADDKWRHFQEGTRLNFKSGNVKVTCCLNGSYFLGIRNPDSSYGVNVSVEVVAITAKNEYVMENN